MDLLSMCQGELGGPPIEGEELWVRTTPGVWFRGREVEVGLGKGVRFSISSKFLGDALGGAPSIRGTWCGLLESGITAAWLWTHGFSTYVCGRMTGLPSPWVMSEFKALPD